MIKNPKSCVVSSKYRFLKMVCSTDCVSFFDVGCKVFCYPPTLSDQLIYNFSISIVCLYYLFCFREVELERDFAFFFFLLWIESSQVGSKTKISKTTKRVIFVLIKILFFVRITGLIRSKSEKSMHLFFKFVISVRKIKNNLGLLIINDHNFVEIKKGHSFHETVYKWKRV